jgi:arabinofuranan 3-O-arabinosyltransferase
LVACGVIGKRREVDLEPALPWKKQLPLWLSIGAVAGVVLVIGGPLVFAVPVLVYIGARRPTWLPVIAFVGMAAAGVIAGLNPGTGALSQLGAFSAPAQVCALIALSAVLVPVTVRRSQPREQPDPISESGSLDPASSESARGTRELITVAHGDESDGETH